MAILSRHLSSHNKLYPVSSQIIVTVFATIYEHSMSRLRTFDSMAQLVYTSRKQSFIRNSLSKYSTSSIVPIQRCIGLVPLNTTYLNRNRVRVFMIIVY